MRVDRDDLRLTGTRVPQYDFAGFSYDPYTLTATWRLRRPMGVDRVELNLASGADGVRTVRGDTPLDGEARPDWPLPSGDGTPGGDYRTHFAVHPGNVQRVGVVDIFDLYQIWPRRYLSIRNPGTPDTRYSIFYDLDGNGRIDAIDVAIVRRAMGTQLPAAPTA